MVLLIRSQVYGRYGATSRRRNVDQHSALIGRATDVSLVHQTKLSRREDLIVGKSVDINELVKDARSAEQ